MTDSGRENVSILIKTKNIRAEFGISRLPHRKAKCLYLMRGAILEPLAYFRSDEDADRFNEILDLIYELLKENEKNHD